MRRTYSFIDIFIDYYRVKWGFLHLCQTEIYRRNYSFGSGLEIELPLIDNLRELRSFITLVLKVAKLPALAEEKEADTFNFF